MRRKPGRAALSVTAAMLAFLAGAADASASNAVPQTLVLGTVGIDAKSQLKEYVPLAKYLQEQLAGSGIERVDPLVLPTAAQMGEAFRKGAVHLYFESPLVAARVGQKGGAVPILRRWKKGVAEYWSEIIVRSESDIRSLDDLRGRVIAFEKPDSTSGHLLPRAVLLKHGLQIEMLNGPADPFDNRKIGAVFTSDDKTSILQLFDGRVAAVATDSEYVKKIEAGRAGAARSIGRSIVVPRHVVMRAANMPEPLVQRITQIFIGMHQSEEGRRVLAAFNGTERFDTLPAGAEATFAPIHEQLRLLDTDPGLASGHTSSE